jgi:hypothetical protein
VEKPLRTILVPWSDLDAFSVPLLSMFVHRFLCDR